MTDLTAYAKSKWQASGLTYHQKAILYTDNIQMQLALINYTGSGKYTPCGNGVSPWWTLEYPKWFDEHFPASGTWWPVVLVWHPEFFATPDLEAWAREGVGGWDCHVMCVYQWLSAKPAAWSARVLRYSHLPAFM